MKDVAKNPTKACLKTLTKTSGKYGHHHHALSPEVIEMLKRYTKMLEKTEGYPDDSTPLFRNSRGVKIQNDVTRRVTNIWTTHFPVSELKDGEPIPRVPKPNLT